MIYVYAIAEGPVAAPSELGIDGHAVQPVHDGTLSALVSRGIAHALEATPAALLSHERVVAAAMEQATVLPMRFGTVVADVEALRHVLGARRAELEESLVRVRGRVELGVRALWSESEPAADPSSGRDFMVRKLELRRAARRAAEELHDPLARLAVDSSCRIAPNEDAAFAAAYLVDRARVPELERCAREIGRSRRDVRLACTGPWPPYSFSEAHDG